MEYPGWLEGDKLLYFQEQSTVMSSSSSHSTLAPLLSLVTNILVPDQYKLAMLSVADLLLLDLAIFLLHFLSFHRIVPFSHAFLLYVGNFLLMLAKILQKNCKKLAKK